MKKILTNIIIFVSLAYNIMSAHCQMPCGIYDDALRIIILKENFKTIKKSMEKINSLNNSIDPLSKNQITRWINTKELHAQDSQNIISEYFLTQRIKETQKEYTTNLKLLHKLLIISMKCKQTVNTKHTAEAISLINEFSKLYFDKHGYEHLKKLSE